MSLYEGMVIFPTDIDLSEAAWSELIQQILLRGEDNFSLHSLKQIVGSPKVPEHLKTADLKNHIAWLQFKNYLPGLFTYRGSSVGGYFDLNNSLMTEIFEWLQKPEQIAIRLRARRHLLIIIQHITSSEIVQQWKGRLASSIC